MTLEKLALVSLCCHVAGVLRICLENPKASSPPGCLEAGEAPAAHNSAPICAQHLVSFPNSPNCDESTVESRNAPPCKRGNRGGHDLPRSSVDQAVTKQ